jgi:chloramphenicol 3-O phosphotransferase
MAARILVLTGASSTGKTTIARALQWLAPKPAVLVAADDYDLPKDARSVVALRQADEDEAAALQAAMFRAFYEGLARWPANGVSAIAETIFLDQDQLCICRDALRGVPHAIVRLICDREVRLERERRRPDRQPGRSEATALTEVIPDGLALEVDTTSCRPADAATKLVAFL